MIYSAKIFLLLILLSCWVRISQPALTQGQISPQSGPESSLEEDLATAFRLRQDAQDIDSRFGAAWKRVCELENGALPNLPLSESGVSVESSSPQENNTPELESLLCSPLPLYTPMISQATFDEEHAEFFDLFRQKGEFFLAMRSEVIQARLNLEAMQKNEETASRELQQAEEDARMSIERTRERVAQPYELEQTQIAVAEAKSNLDRTRSPVSQARKALDHALGLR